MIEGSALRRAFFMAETFMSLKLVVLLLGSALVVALACGLAFYAFRRLHMLEARIRAPLQRRIDLQAEKLRKVRGATAAHDLFLAGLSHELRTPLSGIQGAVQLLQNSRLNSPQREYTRNRRSSSVRPNAASRMRADSWGCPRRS